MFKKVSLLFVLIFISMYSYSQDSVNDYKYVVVPTTFDFLKQENQYRLNTLTKLLFEKYGFIAFMENEKLPEDAFNNDCLVLNSDVIRERGMLNSKLRVQLKNCKGDIVYTSQLGQSREKKYQVAYTIALREAFNSFKTLNYSYQENPIILSYGKVNTSSEEVKKLKQEISQLKEEKEKLEEKPQVISVETKPTVSDSQVQSNSVIESPSLLFAQPISNGFQLVDNTPKVIYKIKKTGMTNVYLVKGQQAIIYQLDANWILEYYEDDKLKTQILNIKF